MTKIIKHFEVIPSLEYLTLALENDINSIFINEGSFLDESFNFQRSHELNMIYQILNSYSYAFYLLEELKFFSQAFSQFFTFGLLL